MSYHINASAVCAVYPAVLQFANLHRAGAAYVSFASAVNWNTVCTAERGISWLLRMRSALENP